MRTFLSSPETAKYLPHLENAIARIVSSILYDEDSEGAFFPSSFRGQHRRRKQILASFYLLNPFFLIEYHHFQLLTIRHGNTPITIGCLSMRCYNRYRLDDTSTAVTVRFVVVSILCSVVTFLFLGVGCCCCCFSSSFLLLQFLYLLYSFPIVLITSVSFVGLSLHYYACLSR